MYAAKIAHRIEGRVWRLWDGDVWERTFSTTVGRTWNSWRFQGTIGLVGVSARDNGRLAAFPAEETHV